MLVKIHKNLQETFFKQLPLLRQLGTYFTEVVPSKLDPRLFQAVESQLTNLEKQARDNNYEDDLQISLGEALELAGRLSGFAQGNPLYYFAAETLIRNTRQLGSVLLMICDVYSSE